MRLVVSTWLVGCLLAASSVTAEPLPFRKLRFEEQWCSTPSRPSDVFDPIKCIALPGPGTPTLGFGGEIRLRYDYTHDPEWGSAPQDEWGAFLQRYLLHADLRWTRHFRAFAQLRSALENGRAAGPSPVEEGKLDFQQLFVDLAAPLGDSIELRARPGRQEIMLGSERLVAVREGPNIRRAFDAARIDLSTRHVLVTAIAGRPVDSQRGVFDDRTDGDRALWGVYATLREVAGTPVHFDLYYLGFDDREAVYDQGPGRERRHSVGARLFGAARGFTWNWEGIYQFGDFEAGRISAWTLATDTTYTFEVAPARPRIVLNANVASGDDDPGDPDLGTFNPLYPRGNYFSHLALLGPRNFVNLHPGVEVEPVEGIVLSADVNFYWRLSRGDGIYGPPGNLLRSGRGASERFVGTALSGGIAWGWGRHLDFTVIYTHAFAGPFIAETGPDEDIDFIELTARYRF